MKISEVMQGIEFQTVQGSDIEIAELQYDSRKIKERDLFVCVEGLQTDGHMYVQQAVSAGAAAVLCQKLPDALPEGVTVLLTENTRKALALCAANFYGHPSKKLELIGVTGTNGKTTTTYFIKSILEYQRKKVGIIGTIENRIGDRVIPTDRTTPESLELQKLLKEMEQEGVSHAAMEVSSHSLALDRVYGCSFSVGIFTNLTRDHLDFHKTMEKYKEAKGILFQMSDSAVINIDDEASAYMCKMAEGKRILTTGIDHKADLQAENMHISADGVSFELEYEKKIYPVFLSTPGKFSIYNALSAIGACLLLHVPIEDILEGLKQNKGVAGRFQTVHGKNGVKAIVDYSHTPDGLENILKTAQEFAKGRILTVFGCGGDRDKTKRPMMGEIAGKLSDYCIITSDNPRTEDPEKIIDDIEPATKATGCPYTRIADRKKAIVYAVSMARPNDLVIIAGKGHETYQIFADKTIHFDDVEAALEAFREVGK